VFGAAALLLTLVGLWARVSWGVASRAREWAIRQAVGAQPREVVPSAAKEVLIVVFMGAAAGAALLPVSSAAVRATIAGLPRRDPRFVLLGILLFAACALASAYLPARRASRVDPASALSSD
jgi:ABC-type antimicrobial peptide transport system permease subunit